MKAHALPLKINCANALNNRRLEIDKYRRPPGRRLRKISRIASTTGTFPGPLFAFTAWHADRQRYSIRSCCVVSHSSAHAGVSRFRGTDVMVLGAGASAIDLAVLLHEAGTRVRLVTRRKSLPIHARMRLPLRCPTDCASR